jgi:YHS domain-containing protein
VETGWHFDDRVQIVKGLAPGEEFVASGNFLIDSESRMKLAAQGLSGTPEVDVVSGKTVVPSQAKAAGLTSEYQGNTYYFSSKESKDQFDQQNRQVERLLRAQQATAPKGREKRHD